MNTRLRFCICGGGSLSHVIVGVLGANEDLEVSLLTRKPEQWQSEIHVIYQDDLELIGHIDRISNDPSEVIPDADVIILAVPSFARLDILQRIRPFVRHSAWIGSFPGSGGFDWLARDILGKEYKIFGLQREPYVCRIISYGQVVGLSGIRSRVYLAAIPCSQVMDISNIIEWALNLPVNSLPNYLSISLTPSNPIFHPVRLYSLFKDTLEYSRKILFYREWDDFSSEVYQKCDREVQEICRAIPLDMISVTSILEHFNVASVKDLTFRIRSIKALQDICVPMIKTKTGYTPDIGSRFFQEDIPYGMLVIKSIAQVVGVPTPMIDEVLYWAQDLLKQEYLVDGTVIGADIKHLPLPQNYGITSLADLVRRATE